MNTPFFIRGAAAGRSVLVNKKYYAPIFFLVAFFALFSFVPKSHAAISFVQSTSSVGSVSCGTSIGKAFGSSVAKGDLLVVGTYDAIGSAVTVTDSLGDTFTKVVTASNASDHDSSIFIAPTTSAGADTITVADSNGVCAISIHEYSGTATSSIASIVDATSTQTGNSAALSAGNITTHAANDLVFAYFATGDDNASTVFTYNPNYSRRELASGITGFCARVFRSANCIASESAILSSAGTTNATTTISSGADQWTGVSVAFKAASTATGSIPTISSFSALPTVVASAGASILSWNVSNASSVVITPGGFSTSTFVGSTTVNPTSTTVYTLSATNSVGTSTATTSVGVATAPTAPGSLTVNNITTSTLSLSWTSSTPNNGAGISFYSLYGGTSTSTMPRIATTTGLSFGIGGLSTSTTYFYYVTAQDSVGNTSASSSIASGTTLTLQAPVISSFIATPASIFAGQTSTLSWMISYATSLSIDQGIGTVMGTSIGVAPTTTMLYTLTAVNGVGSTTAQATVTVSPDNVLPTTSITNPTNNATVSGVTSVSALASDNVGVTKVELYVDGTLSSSDTATPYNFSFDTTSLSNASHTLQTKAYDAAGNVGVSAVITVVVNNGSGGHYYMTNFPYTQNPISENNNWVNGGAIGLDWGNVQSTPGLGFGVSLPSTYGDPSAILTGTWSPTQSAQGTVKIVGSAPSSCCHEVEVRLRSTISAHLATGYEILCSVVPSDPYMQVVRWNGLIGDFSYVTVAGNGNVSCANGDVLGATISGNTITAYKNGVQILQGTDNTWTSGNPGLGFYDNQDSNWSNFGFLNFTASDGMTGDTTPPTVSLTAPTNGATVSSTVTLSATASDNVGVASVAFSVDGSTVATIASIPYTFSWDSTSVANGSHAIIATAMDTSGNIATSSAATVTVTNASSSGSSIAQISGQNSGESQCATTLSNLAFPNNVTSGNQIIVIVDAYRNGTTPPTVSAPAKNSGTATIGSFSLDNTFTTASGNNRNVVNIYRASVTGSGSLTIKFTIGNSPQCGIATLDEFSGIATTNPVDVIATSTGTGVTESNMLTTSASGMTLMYSSEVSTGNFTYAQSGTNIFKDQNGNSDFTGEAQYRTTTGPGTYSLTAGTGNSWPWFAVGVAYKAAP